MCNGDPAVVVDRAIAEHLKVLCLALGRSFGVLFVPGVRHAHASDRLLRNTVDHHRCLNSRGFKNGRHDVDHVVELGANPAGILDAAGLGREIFSVDGCGGAGRTRVAVNLLGVDRQDCQQKEKNGKSRSERISRPIEALQAIELFAHLTIRFCEERHGTAYTWTLSETIGVEYGRPRLECKLDLSPIR
jgi:hypothetical protein